MFSDSVLRVHVVNNFFNSSRFRRWRVANVSPKKNHLNLCTVLNVLDKYLLLLGGDFATWGCTPQASFLDIDKEEFFNSTEIKRYNVNLERMPLMCHENRSPGATFIDGRILAYHLMFEIFTPSCMSPWSPKEGQWTRVAFAHQFTMAFLRSNCEGAGLVNLSETIYALGEFYAGSNLALLALIRQNFSIQICEVSISFAGRRKRAALLKRATKMDDKEDPLGLQHGPFSFSMVRCSC